MLRGFAARFTSWGRTDTGPHDIGPQSTPEPEPPVAPADAIAGVVTREPVDDCGNYYAWPDDPDEVPDWVIAAEAQRLRAGITDRLPARTLREFWAQLEMCAVTVDSEVVVQAPPQAALPPLEAARVFLDDLMAESKELGEVLHLSVADMAQRYEAHCARANRAPCPIEQMKGKLARFPGCTRTKAEEKRNGRRYRPVVWIIDPEAAAIVESAAVVPMFKMAA